MLNTTPLNPFSGADSKETEYWCGIWPDSFKESLEKDHNIDFTKGGCTKTFYKFFAGNVSYCFCLKDQCNCNGDQCNIETDSNEPDHDNPDHDNPNHENDENPDLENPDNENPDHENPDHENPDHSNSNSVSIHALGMDMEIYLCSNVLVLYSNLQRACDKILLGK